MSASEKQPFGSVILLDRREDRAAAFATLHPRVVSSVSELNASAAEATKDSLWVSYARDLTLALVQQIVPPRSSLGCGLFLHALDLRSIPVLTARFRHIAFAVDGNFLSPAISPRFWRRRIARGCSLADSSIP